jgi:hypothetical protein
MKYDIKANDTFAPGLYPEVIAELAVIRNRMVEMKSTVKGEMVISFYKDHCLQNTWITENKAITKLLISNKAPDLESLFVNARGKTQFLSGLEAFITTEMK